VDEGGRATEADKKEEGDAWAWKVRTEAGAARREGGESIRKRAGGGEKGGEKDSDHEGRASQGMATPQPGG